MSLDAIKKTIQSDAEAKAKAADAESNREAKSIVSEAEARAAQITKSAEADAAKEAERQRRESRAGAETEANSMLLQARGEVVEAELKKVLKALEEDLMKNSQKRIFEAALKQFKALGEGGRITVRTSKKNAAILKGSAYAFEPAEIDGFILSSENGKVSLNATVESMAGREKDSARNLISQELFGSKTRAKKAVQAKPKKAAPVKAKRQASKKSAPKAKGKRKR